ncbi:MAG: hypothetical protein JXR41_01495 [Bacteroidales bacterium]|nr:hypothetical protein [Bacteroidales bacterium]MBN2761734.1 hypothetical protein [Bacteroidales bacterium]
MKTYIKLTPLIILCSSLLTQCEKDSNDPDPVDVTGGYIASYNIASEQAVRSIPEQYIDVARNTLHIAYQHTSHGTHVSFGLFGLQDYKPGDDVLFGITNNDPEPGKLDFRDYAMGGYAAAGEDASDLSRNETAFIQATRNFLDDPDNSEINVVMWSWCSIRGHDVAGHYLPGMQTLINEYGEGGSRIGSNAGQREVPVTFIFMTGHAETDNNVGNGKPKNQADTIIGYCKANGYYCLDYYGIDTHDMNDNYWEDAGDDGNSEDYGGNFYKDWQTAHKVGRDYFENRSQPGGSVTYGNHNTQHIIANRKAYAMWWILAQIAGWEGE